ncbi:MAG: hypothetical protein JWQ70_1526 [Aeromicrobium sp.]|nr:hypothetical protein [Aeromicrobium sp.]
MRLPLVPVTLLTLLLLGACQSSDGGKPSATDTTTSATSSAPTTPVPSGPSCTGIWQQGMTLPKTYTRCVVDGALGAQDVTKCKDGTQLVAYADAYYANTGGTIKKPTIAPMQDTPAFAKAYASCTGE